MSDSQTWKRCSSCKKPIAHEQTYYVCSVSTCNRKRTGLLFCSVACFDAHLPMMRHRDAWAEQERAPTRAQAEAEASENAEEPEVTAPRRVIASPSAAAADEDAQEILVVVSKLKKFIRTKSGMSTSDGAMAVVSDHLRWLGVGALRHAAEQGRKTVLERDFQAVIDRFRRGQGG